MSGMVAAERFEAEAGRAVAAQALLRVEPLALRVRQVELRLRATRRLRLPFFHGGVLRGLVSAALEVHRLPVGVIPVAVETGRVEIGEGEGYRFGVRWVGGDLGWAEGWEARLVEGLERVGGLRMPRGRSVPRLAGNFVVEAVEELPVPDLRADLSALRGLADRDLRLRFVAPLRLRRPREAQRPGRGFFDEQYFPAEVFLDRLARRLFLLAHGRHPSLAERAAFTTFPTNLTSDPSGLVWLDVPTPGRGRRERTLGGVVGEVRLGGVPEEWLPFLVAGQYGHAGASTHFALGRYLLPELGGDVFQPARPLLAKVCEPEELRRAAGRVGGAGPLAGRGEERSGRALDRWLGELSFAAATGSYQPGPYRGLLETQADGATELVARPDAQDRLLQSAAASILREPLTAFVEGSSEAFRRGHARAGIPRALRRAWDEGFRLALEVDRRALYELVDREALLHRLGALLPREPLLPLIRGWLEARVELDDEAASVIAIRRRQRISPELSSTPEKKPRLCHRGLPRSSPLSRLLLTLCLEQIDKALGAEGRLIRYGDAFLILLRSPKTRLQWSHLHARGLLRRLVWAPGQERDRPRVVIEAMEATSADREMAP